MTRYWIALAASALGAAACLYGFVFFGWMSATSDSGAMRDQARELMRWWCIGFGVSLLAIAIVVIRLLVPSTG